MCGVGSGLLDGEVPINDRSAALSWARRYWVAFLVALVLTALPVAALVRNSPGSWTAAQGGGVPGTFVASGECGKDWCSGRFVSDDGQDVRDPVRLVTDYGQMNPGDRVRAVDVGDFSVYKVNDFWPMVQDLGFIVVIGLIVFTTIGVKITDRVRARRTASETWQPT